MKFTSNIHPMIYLGHVHFQAKSQGRPGHLKFLSCPLHGGLPIWQFSFIFFTNINPWGNNVLTTISRPKSQRSRSHRTFKFLLYLFLLCPLRGYRTMDGADTVKTDTAKTIWPILFIYCTRGRHVTQQFLVKGQSHKVLQIFCPQWWNWLQTCSCPHYIITFLSLSAFCTSDWIPGRGYASSDALWISVFVDTLRPKQNSLHFPYDIFKCIYLNENVWISIRISLRYVPKGPFNNIPALVR